MKRLFWKIFIAFWLTLTATTSALILVLLFATPTGRELRHGGMDYPRQERITSAQVALAAGGQPALQKVVQAWPADVRSRLVISPNGSGPPTISLTDPPFNWARQFNAVPAYLLGGLIFSALLASYVTRPIAHLRHGFNRVAGGDFSVRLAPLMKRRRDEVADLARDFDRMTDQLEQLIAARDRLMHDVSHELRSPLARLDLIVALARLEGDRGDGVFNRIEAESARINALVGDLLSLSRAENDATAAVADYFDLASLLQVVCTDAAFEAQASSVAVELDVDAALTDEESAPIMTGAPELLRRAVENVVRNAVRFSPKGGAVAVRAIVDDADIVIEVQDRGPGVAADMLERMFDPFVKGPGEARGVGLGLAIARRAIATYHGQIQAENVATGGLLVRLRFPQQRTVPAAIGGLKPAPQPCDWAAAGALRPAVTSNRKRR